MGFQILNKDNQPLSMSVLDVEAAEFWGQQVDKKWYATPTSNPRGNWFDYIGYNIHKPEVTGFGADWKAVKMSLFQVQFNFDLSAFLKGEKTEEQLTNAPKEILVFLKDYFALIDHWESKGYQPKQVAE